MNSDKIPLSKPSETQFYFFLVPLQLTHQNSPLDNRQYKLSIHKGQQLFDSMKKPLHLSKDTTNFSLNQSQILHFFIPVFNQNRKISFEIQLSRATNENDFTLIGVNTIESNPLINDYNKKNIKRFDQTIQFGDQIILKCQIYVDHSKIQCQQQIRIQYPNLFSPIKKSSKKSELSSPRSSKAFSAIIDLERSIPLSKGQSQEIKYQPKQQSISLIASKPILKKQQQQQQSLDIQKMISDEIKIIKKQQQQENQLKKAELAEVKNKKQQQQQKNQVKKVELQEFKKIQQSQALIKRTDSFIEQNQQQIEKITQKPESLIKQNQKPKQNSSSCFNSLLKLIVIILIGLAFFKFYPQIRSTQQQPNDKQPIKTKKSKNAKSDL